jgi:hypothetical protein
VTNAVGRESRIAVEDAVTDWLSITSWQAISTTSNLDGVISR